MIVKKYFFIVLCAISTSQILFSEEPIKQQENTLSKAKKSFYKDVWNGIRSPELDQEREKRFNHLFNQYYVYYKKGNLKKSSYHRKLFKRTRKKCKFYKKAISYYINKTERKPVYQYGGVSDNKLSCVKCLQNMYEVELVMAGRKRS